MANAEKDDFDTLVEALEDELAEQYNNLLLQDKASLPPIPTSKDYKQAGDRTANIENTKIDVLAEMHLRFKDWSKRLRDTGFVVALSPRRRALLMTEGASSQQPSTEVRVVKVKVGKKMTDEYAKEVNQKVGGRLEDDTIIGGLYYWNKDATREFDRKNFSVDKTPQLWIDWMNKQTPVDKGFIRAAVGRLYKRVSYENSLVTSTHRPFANIKTLGDFRNLVKLFPQGVDESYISGTTLFLKEVFMKPPETEQSSSSDQ